MMSKYLKTTTASIATVFVATSALALDLGVGASVGGIGVGVGASVGHGSVADAGVGVGVGGTGAGVGASVGGGSVASVGAGVGGTGGSGSGTNGGTVTDGGGTVADNGGTTGTPTDMPNTRRTARDNATVPAGILPIRSALGATVITSDRHVVGMIEDVRPSSQGKFVATIRMNVAFGADRPTIQINLPAPKKETDSIRLGYTKSGLMQQLQG